MLFSRIVSNENLVKPVICIGENKSNQKLFVTCEEKTSRLNKENESYSVIRIVFTMCGISKLYV